MSHIITSVDAFSPAARAGIAAGDRLRAINDEIVFDFLDYQALTAEKRVRLEILRDGERREISITKGEYEPLGLNFATPMMSGVRWCCNKCLFCFVDQLPKGVRPSMRVKDDDWRTSLMMGSYVTLTNVSDRELQRIVRRRASPLYISVHATDPDLRSKLLGTPRGAMLMDQLNTFKDGGIDFHTQAVLCPGLNDGEALDQTIRDLTALYPAACSLALVPVGLTGFREGLYPIAPYTRDEARRVLDQAEAWQAKLLREIGTRFVFPSDEFYIIAERPIPPDEAYEGYQQIDDGVGMLRLFETEFEEAYQELPAEETNPTPGGKKLVIAAGMSSAPFFQALMETHPVRGVRVEVRALTNHFFGSSVTVSGLLTGGDLVSQMRGVEADAVLITELMLRDHENCFLDDMTLDEAQAKLGKPIIPVGRRGDDLLAAIRAQATEDQ